MHSDRFHRIIHHRSRRVHGGAGIRAGVGSKLSRGEAEGCTGRPFELRTIPSTLRLRSARRDWTNPHANYATFFLPNTSSLQPRSTHKEGQSCRSNNKRKATLLIVGPTSQSPSRRRTPRLPSSPLSLAETSRPPNPPDGARLPHFRPRECNTAAWRQCATRVQP